MSKLVSWSAEDEAVAGTNNDATECKLGAVQLGYWADPYVRFFARRAERRAPEINRGYYARVRAVEMFIHQFLEVRSALHPPPSGPRAVLGGAVFLIIITTFGLLLFPMSFTF